MTKGIHGVTAFTCCKCGKNKSIDVYLPEKITDEEWMELWARIIKEPRKCEDCKK